jgi:hypothetical protein
MGEELISGDDLKTSTVYLSSVWSTVHLYCFKNIWKCLLLFELPISYMWCIWDNYGVFICCFGLCADALRPAKLYSVEISAVQWEARRIVGSGRGRFEGSVSEYVFMSWGKTEQISDKKYDFRDAVRNLGPLE